MVSALKQVGPHGKPSLTNFERKSPGFDGLTSRNPLRNLTSWVDMFFLVGMGGGQVGVRTSN